MQSNRKLLISALTKFIIGILILGAFLFVAAGDFRYWNAWVFLSAFAVCIFAFGAGLYLRDKELLQKRLNSKEKEEEQKAYTWLSGISFIATFGVCGIDYRFSWSRVPIVAVFVALAVMIAGFGLFVVTLMYNRYASSRPED